jgi:type II secretory pathway pseudopilin PulG
MTSLPTALPRFGRQRGISLIELMIGMLLGLILLAGVILMFTSGNEVNRNRQAMSLISDNARFAIEHMNRHLRMADSIEANGNTLTASLFDGNTVVYSLDSSENEVLFDNGNGDDIVLVDGVSALDFEFGVGDATNKTLIYSKTVSTGEDVLSIRVNMKLVDSSGDGAPLATKNNEVSSTIALRNPLLAAVSGLDDDASTPGSGPTDGGDPSIPPDEEGPVDEEPPSPPPEEDDGSNTENTEQLLPDQQVCPLDTVEISGVKNNAKVILNTVVGQGAFLGCDDKGKSRTCRGRASTKSSFSAIITVGKGKKDEKTFQLEFSCIQNNGA